MAGSVKAFGSVKDLRINHTHNWSYWKTKLLCKFKISLIVCGHRHDRARAVSGQDVICNPNWN